MPQSFHPLKTKEKRTLLAKGEETTTPQAIMASNSRVPKIHVHQENTQLLLHHKLLKIKLLCPKSMCTSGKHTIFH